MIYACLYMTLHPKRECYGIRNMNSHIITKITAVCIYKHSSWRLNFEKKQGQQLVACIKILPILKYI